MWKKFSSCSKVTEDAVMLDQVNSITTKCDSVTGVRDSGRWLTDLDS